MILLLIRRYNLNNNTIIYRSIVNIVNYYNIITMRIFSIYKFFLQFEFLKRDG